MIPIIENEKEFAGTILKNCIAALRVWNDDQQCNITYYYRKTFQKGEKIEAQLKSAKKPGKTTTLRKVKYNSLVNRLEKMYKGMYPGEPVNLAFGTWKPYNKK